MIAHPYRDGTLLNLMGIPISIKNYLTAISDLNIRQAAVVLLPGNMLLSLMCALAGSEITDVKEMFTSKGFHQKSTKEKINSLVMLACTLLTLSLIVIVAIYYRKKYNAYRLRTIRDVDSTETQRVETSTDQDTSQL